MNRPVQVQEIETSPGGGFSVAMVGPLPLVLPLGAVLTDERLRAVANVCDLLAAGQERPAAAILTHIERQLGVTQELHIAGVLAAAARLAEQARADGEARDVAAAGRAKALMDPIRPRPLTDAAGLSMAEAELKRAVAVAATKAKDHRTARAALTEARKHEIRAANAQRVVLDAVWIEGAEAETVALRSARGDDLVTPPPLDGEDEIGMLPRFSVRDGLTVLFERGAINSLHEMAGRSYRTMREDAPERLRSQMAAHEGRGGGDPVHGRIVAGFKRAKAGVCLTRVEFEVARLGARELRVLRWVAGASGSINALGPSGHQRELNTKALVRALDKAAWVMWDTAPLRITGN